MASSHPGFSKKKFSVLITILPRACCMPSLPCYIIVDVKFNVILFYSKASSARTYFKCIIRRIYQKIFSFNAIFKNVTCT